MHGCRALIFDLDDTLVDSRAAYAAALSACGIDGDDPDGAYARARRAVKARLPADSPSAHGRLLYFHEMARAASATDSPGRAALHSLALHARYEAHLLAHIAGQWQALRRGALLRALAARYPCALLTNETARTQLQKWQAMDPEGALFVGMVSSEEVGHDKPHPAMFAAAAALLGVAPAACLMVGDSPRHDVAGAQACGMAALLTVEFGAPAAAVPSDVTVLPRLEALRERLL